MEGVYRSRAFQRTKTFGSTYVWASIPAATNSFPKHSMFSRSASSSGMRLVPATNSQKLSASRLNYKAFGGAKPARSKGELSNV